MGSRFPSNAVPEASQDTYLVLDDFGGRQGRAWRETDEEATSRDVLIRDLMDGQYGNRRASSPSTPLRAGRAM